MGIPTFKDYRWQSYTPTTVGVGTITAASFLWRRNGDSIEIQGKFTSGSVTGVNVKISLPTGLSADSTKLASGISLVGVWERNASGTSGYVVLVDSSDLTNLQMGNVGGGSGPLVAVPVSTSSETQAFFAKVPIAGW